VPNKGGGKYRKEGYLLLGEETLGNLTNPAKRKSDKRPNFLGLIPVGELGKRFRKKRRGLSGDVFISDTVPRFKELFSTRGGGGIKGDF